MTAFLKIKGKGITHGSTVLTTHYCQNEPWLHNKQFGNEDKLDLGNVEQNDPHYGAIDGFFVPEQYTRNFQTGVRNPPGPGCSQGLPDHSYLGPTWGTGGEGGFPGNSGDVPEVLR